MHKTKETFGWPELLAGIVIGASLVVIAGKFTFQDAKSQWGRDAVESGYAYYDAKTGKLTFKKSCNND